MGGLYAALALLPHPLHATAFPHLLHPGTALLYTAFFLLGGEAAWGLGLGLLLEALLGPHPWPRGLILAAAQLTGAGLGWLVLRGPLAIRPTLDRLQDYLRWALVAGLASAAFGALPVAWVSSGSGTRLGDPDVLGPALARLAALACLGPVLLVDLQPRLGHWLRGASSPVPAEPSPTRRPRTEAVMLAGITLLLLWASFQLPASAPHLRTATRLACLLAGVWAALRLDFPAATRLIAALGLLLAGSLAFQGPVRVSQDELRAFQLLLALLGLAGTVAGLSIRESRILEAQHRALMDGSVDPIVLVDDQGRLVSVNPAFLRLTGLAHRHLPPYRDLFTDAHVPALRSGRWMEALLQRPGHDPIPVEFSTLRLPRGLQLVTIRDLRSRQAAEALKVRLAAQRDQLHRMEAVSGLAGGVAHELNTHLTVLLGTLDRIQPLLPGRGPAADLGRQALDSALNAATTVQQLKALSQQALLLPTPVRLPDLARSVLKQTLRSSEGSFTLRLDLPEDLPPISADPELVGELLAQVLTNAVEAMPQGGALTLTAGLRLPSGASPALGAPQRTEEWVVLEIEDTGPGMDEATRRRAFDPFFTTKGPGSNRGLGLSIVFGRVKQVGGWVQLESQLGAGTRVTLGFLPAPEPALPDRPVPSPPPAPEGLRKALVVDDEETLRELMRVLLEAQGFEVTTAMDGQDGLDRFMEGPDTFSLVVLDLIMPRLHGFQVLEAIHATRPQTRVLVCSGYTEEARPDLMAFPHRAFLAKPFRLNEFQSALAQLAPRT